MSDSGSDKGLELQRLRRQRRRRRDESDDSELSDSGDSAGEESGSELDPEAPIVGGDRAHRRARVRRRQRRERVVETPSLQRWRAWVFGMTVLLLLVVVVALELLCLYYGTCFNLAEDPAVPRSGGDAVVPVALVLLCGFVPVGMRIARGAPLSRSSLIAHVVLGFFFAVFLFSAAMFLFAEGTDTKTQEWAAAEWAALTEDQQDWYGDDGELAAERQKHFYALAALGFGGSVVLCCGVTGTVNVLWATSSPGL